MEKIILGIASLLLFSQNKLSAQISVAELTQQITQGRTSDSAKLVAIYDWLTQNVRYDNAHRRQREGDTVLRQEPYNVVVLKKAVCMGYAKTLREMCRLSGIECYLVEGHVKNSSGVLQREGHAWNVAKVNGNWYPLDATWDAGEGILQKKYFLKDPSVFVENHLPCDPIWQLLPSPISVNCFKSGTDCGDDSPTLSAFNPSDSIRFWQSLDSTQKVYNQSVRILKFNPNDLNAVHDLADYYQLKAKLSYTAYQQIRKDVADKKRPPNGKKSVLELLETASNFLQSAQKYYQVLVSRKTTNELTDAHLNLESIEEKLNNLASEKTFVERFFKE